MLNKLKNIFSSGGSKPSVALTTQTSSFAPKQPLYIIGDVHGCATLLDKMLDRIDVHGVTNNVINPMLILVGDYVDRGPQSAQVLERIYTLQQDTPERVICLMGNHEKMMLDFIDDPAGGGNRWLTFGGGDTLKSYGIKVPGKKADIEDLTEASIELESAMPKGLQAWLRALPLTFQSGNIACVHAAMDPSSSPDKQSSRILLWGHPDFMSEARVDDLWVAHGHTIVKSAACQNSRIALDTGAYRTGRLSVAAVSGGHCTFL
jgi:serine/threonine protein phosphatase 1